MYLYIYIYRRYSIDIDMWLGLMATYQLLMILELTWHSPSVPSGKQRCGHMNRIYQDFGYWKLKGIYKCLISIMLSINWGTPIAGWFVRENPTQKMDDLGVPPYGPPPKDHPAAQKFLLPRCQILEQRPGSNTPQGCHQVVYRGLEACWGLETSWNVGNMGSWSSKWVDLENQRSSSWLKRHTWWDSLVYLDHPTEIRMIFSKRMGVTWELTA